MGTEWKGYQMTTNSWQLDMQSRGEGEEEDLADYIWAQQAPSSFPN